MRIAVLSNVIAGGWHPDDLDTFLGGNEECLLLLASALARAGHEVEVFTTVRGDVVPYDAGVSIFQREFFHPEEGRDVFISWKDREVWRQPVNACVKIHASQDVEVPLPMDQIDYVTVLGTYHSERMPWVPPEKTRIMPLGVEVSEYHPAGEKAWVALYATSPDRGLETLLRDWVRIRAHRPELELLITYDWDRLMTMSGPNGAAYAKHLEVWLDQPGITRETFSRAQMRDAFQGARYYIHPLPRPDADLFGFGAMKAQACGCTLVLPDTLDNGFRDMARQWIPYSRFVEGSTLPLFNPRYCQPPESWDAIVAKYWAPLLEGAA